MGGSRGPLASSTIWRERYGKMNEHNGWVPRDFWLADWENQAIIGFHLMNPLEGSWWLTLNDRVRSGRITGNPEIVPR
ncbi:MAG: hypothetical protein NVS9B13_23910 [Candidatus Acidiferrum sp.]